MVSFQIIQQSNAHLAALPQGLVALFIGATSGIGQSALQHFAQNASSPRIYTVARETAVYSHSNLISSLRESNPSAHIDVITADVSLISEIDKIADTITQKETRIDIVVLSAGFMAFEGRVNTREGLEPSMTTRYYSRLRLIQQLLPLLNNSEAASPRVISVLGGGLESPINESDLDLRNPENWSFWNATWHSATMGTLAFEILARRNPRLSIVHWLPGPVATPGLARAKKFGFSPPNQISQDEAGQRAIFLATSDRYAVHEGLIPIPAGLDVVEQSGGGIFLINPQGESTDNEVVLADFRKRGVDVSIWSFTQQVFADCSHASERNKDES
ncbi:hypothetical protein BX600DRAFT_461235 [Xylariales sp. PMI_506]|nr:hypothetical protein BX600DRAFT_461235 [Xylariales sp. PMI_506]